MALFPKSELWFLVFQKFIQTFMISAYIVEKRPGEYGDFYESELEKILNILNEKNLAEKPNAQHENWKDFFPDDEEIIKAEKPIDTSFRYVLSKFKLEERKKFEYVYNNLIYIISTNTDSLGKKIFQDALHRICKQQYPPSIIQIMPLPLESRVYCSDKTDEIYGYCAEIPDNLMARSPSELGYVLCSEFDSREIERCKYSEGHVFVRRRSLVTTTVRSARTGKVRSKHTFSGPMPRKCDWMEGAVQYEDKPSPKIHSINGGIEWETIWDWVRKEVG